MRLAATLFLATILLTATAYLRAPEYDEAYSIFLTAGHARPAWPTGIFHPADVRYLYTGHSSLTHIARDLRAGDVHPPLYFWVLEFWRSTFGPSWFAARMLSVVFSLGALTALAWLAAQAEIPVIPTLLITLLSYGFADTGIVARGFALAQLLNILGTALVFYGTRDRKWAFSLAGGLTLGAASFTNYLAIFTGIAGAARSRLPAVAALGLALFLPADTYFFLAQRSSRIGQFDPFSPLQALALLVRDSGAVIFGALPIYAGRADIFVIAALAVLSAVIACCIIKNWRPNLWYFALATLATPLGLLVLGLIFNNTPIEIRYLAFSMPFAALLLAQTLPRTLLYLLLAVEAGGIFGLATAPATMQPQALAAHQIAALATPSTLALLPFGNDGVGIPGPFIAAAPNNLRLLLVKPNRMPNLAAESRVILATLNADPASRQANTQILTMLRADSCWRQQSSSSLAAVFNRICPATLNQH